MQRVWKKRNGFEKTVVSQFESKFSDAQQYSQGRDKSRPCMLP